MYELFQLSDLQTSDYESYVFCMTVGDLISKCHSSPIQRIRNEKKEKGIMKFIENHLENNTTPFFQPFILHYSGDIIITDNKNILNPVPNFDIEVETSEGIEIKRFEFEVIDGNGRLNAMIRLNQKYTDHIAQLNKDILNMKENRKIKLAKKRIFELKTKMQSLKNTNLVIQLYLNLIDRQKMDLFNSVNQGEQMSKGRLQVYDKSNKENILLHDYILHTQQIEFPYIITADKDSLRSKSDRDKYIPAVYILPVFKKLVKYYGKDTDIDEYKDQAFDLLDTYICDADNPPHLRKQFFSILGTVIENAIKYEGDLEKYALRVIEFDHTPYGDVSKQLRKIRAAIVEYVFKDAILLQENVLDEVAIDRDNEMEMVQ